MAEPVLKKGSNDPAVRDLQAALKALGHDPGPIDGVFGPTTEVAVCSVLAGSFGDSVTTAGRPAYPPPFCTGETRICAVA